MQISTGNDALRAMVRLQYFSAAFYQKALETVYPLAWMSDERSVFTQIAGIHGRHVTALRSALGAQAPQQPSVTSYDFTAGSGTGCGPFRGVFGASEATAPNGSTLGAENASKTECLKLAILLEDFACRAYLQCLRDTAETAHAVTIFGLQTAQARMAAAVRRLWDSYDPNSLQYRQPLEVLNSLSPVTIPSYPGYNPTIPFDYGVFGYSQTPPYTGSVSQYQMATGAFTTATDEDGIVTITITHPGIYGPGVPVQGLAKKSTGEDNVVQSSSLAKDVIVPSSLSFDEPMALAAIETTLSLFDIA